MKIKLFILISLFNFIFISQAFAVGESNDITITCTQNGPCTMVPAPTDDLFHETNILPGDTFNQRLTVINQDPTIACNLNVQVTHSSQTLVSFPQQLFTAIKKDNTTDVYGIHNTPTTASNSKTLADLYAETQIDLTTIPANGEAVYDWTVTFDPQAGNDYQNKETIFDFQTVFSCTNQATTQLLLTKTNNKLGVDTSPGDTVTYTLQVTALDDVDDVQVFDLPPGGFVYQPGSWTSSSSTRGNLKPGITSEPSYASPGTWQLGDMVQNEVVTLTYDAKISGDQKSGLYKDLAWTTGMYQGSEVLGNLDTGIFVGTQVNVVLQNSLSGSYQSGQILGASTELPATGAPTIYILLSIVLFIVSLILLNPKIFKYKFIFIILCSSILFITSTSFASAYLSIRLSEPKSPTNEKNLELNFVTLNTINNSINVTCYLKAPGAGSFTQFDSSKTLINGGNTGSCFTNDSLINQEGEYQFKVIAVSGADTSESNLVSVTESQSTPSKVENYSKNSIDSCTIKLKFKTANDNQTNRVEIYRSENQSFTTDGSTRITSIDIGFNQEKEYIDHLPNCGTTYYYAIRAFNSIGNGSDLVGDITFVSATPNPTSSSLGAIPAKQSQIQPPTTSISPGSILGESITASASPTILTISPSPESSTQPTPSPEKTLNSAITSKIPYFILIILTIGILWFVIKRKH